MDFWDLIRNLVIVIGVALIIGVISKKIKQSTLVGYIITGILIAPFLSEHFPIREIAELGITLMLFSIGLEFSINRLFQMGKITLIGGTLQILVTSLVFFLLLVIKLSFNESIIIGLILSLSSTVVTVRILKDNDELDSIHGRICLGILVAQDLAIVPLIIFIGFLSGSNIGIVQELFTTIITLLAVIISFYVIFYKIIPKLLKTDLLSGDRDFIVLLALISAIGSAYATHSVKLSPSLGSFIAGILLAESPFSTQIRSDVGSIRILFVTIFFVSVGMLIKPYWIINYGIISISLVIACIFIKTLVMYVINKKTGFDTISSAASGLFLSNIGEFSFVLATIALSKQIISEEIFAIVVTSSVFSLILAPHVINLGLMLRKRALKVFYYDENPTEYSMIEDGPDIIIIGYGPVGKKIAKVLLTEGVRIKIIEFNLKSYNQAIIDGYNALLGNASNIEILKHAGLLKSKKVIISLMNVDMVRRIVVSIKMLAPTILIYSRVHYKKDIDYLKKAGADFIIDEEELIGKVLAEKAIENLESINSLKFIQSVTGKN